MPAQADLNIERGGNVTIVAANLFLLDIAERGEDLAAAIGAAPPAAWPPEHNDAAMFAWVRKGPPGDDGSVEIGYSVIPEAQRRGFASGTVALLVVRAFRDPRVMAVRAETLPDGIASQAVLRRCGFAQAGTRRDDDDGDVVCFELRRY